MARTKSTPLPRRTWPMGTVRRGFVVAVIPGNRNRASGCPPVVVVFQADGEEAEAFVLAWQDELRDCVADERGVITFTAGGPEGAYWHYRKDPCPTR